MNQVLIKNYEHIPINQKEILRYYGDKNTDLSQEEYKKILSSKDIFEFKILYTVLPLIIDDDKVDFGVFSVKSKDLSKNLKDCKSAVLFLASIGSKIDREIKKYSLISPSKSLFFQALGTERVESLCDVFCKGLNEEYGAIRPRFSPGYGDVSLEVQKEFFKILSPNGMGVFLGENLLMSPSKSVTAFVGLSDNVKECKNADFGVKCDNCLKENCEYR